MARNGDKILNYKGYHGSIEVSVDDDLIYGKVLYVRDLISYDASSVAGIKAAFEEAVDRYLAFCAEVGDSPEKPFSGSFNVRIDQSLHREAVIAADREGISLNQFVENAVRSAVFDKKQKRLLLDSVHASSSSSQSFHASLNPVDFDLPGKSQLRRVS